jgi:phosphatidylglycerol---prolipoprotein diacylglyceryl transferase
MSFLMLIMSIRFEELGLSSVAYDFGLFQLRWYSLAYFMGILLGWWQIARMQRKSGAPLLASHVDDFVVAAAIGIIVGGRLGFIAFYQPQTFSDPLSVLKLWEGGMSFHGGVIGVMIAFTWFCRTHKLSWLRMLDYVAVVYPLGHLFGRLANFVNGELWGRPSDVPWAIIFPNADNVARHPSQLYQAASEGVLLGIILLWLFWRTDARLKPGLLAGVFVGGMGLFRFIGEFYREPDKDVYGLFGMTMGQTLCVPMIICGIYLCLSIRKRVETMMVPSELEKPV